MKEYRTERKIRVWIPEYKNSDNLIIADYNTLQQLDKSKINLNDYHINNINIMTSITCIYVTPNETN